MILPKGGRGAGARGAAEWEKEGAGLAESRKDENGKTSKFVIHCPFLAKCLLSIPRLHTSIVPWYHRYDRGADTRLGRVDAVLPCHTIRADPPCRRCVEALALQCRTAFREEAA